MNKNISKLISYWLRHNPGAANLEVDDFGWTDVESLLAALKVKGIFLSVEELKLSNNHFDKVR